MGQARIKLQDISKSYFSETAVTQALRRVNLTFENGEFVAITGESGSGKSTLLHIIGGLDTFDEGEMYVDGEATSSYSDEEWENLRRNKIGYVFQDYSLIGHYTALDNCLSALLIMGKEPEEAKSRAMEYLKKVGLEGYENHRASDLSSGQKQRLAIARALAKDTGIIIADEPTGNLDSETGEQVIKLLKELSENCLIIMVTHNYAQAADYVTRKIYIHEGTVISDFKVNEQNEEVKSEECEVKVRNNIQEEPDSFFKKQLLQIKEAWFFAKRNRKTQRGRAFIFSIFLLFVSVCSFFAIGQLQMQADDTHTKDYGKTAFYREDDTRIVVKHNDGSNITEEDVEELKDILYVNQVDSCDIANDINYYLESGEDYEFIYGRENRGRPGTVTVNFLNENRFMMSASALSEEDLAAGTLPTNNREIVIYSEDENDIGDTYICYFAAPNLWGSDQYCSYTLTVSGILKEETEQTYFPEELCLMLSYNISGDVARVCFAYDSVKQDYEQKPEQILIVDDTLSGDKVMMSEKSGTLTNGMTLFRYQNAEGEIVEQDVNVLNGTHKNTAMFLAVSQELFDKYVTYESNQASVYICNYGKTDEVIKKLEKAGYTAVSTYRLSVGDYNTKLVNERLTYIGIWSAGLVLLILAESLILRAMMKIRIKDYFILKFIGMKMPVISKITILEILSYCFSAMIITVAAAWILKFAGIGLVEEMLWYYLPVGYLIFAAFNILLTMLTAGLFNRSLRGRLQ